MSGSSRLVGLDGLRGIAALSVVMLHAIMAQTGSSQGNAYLAVDFFFLLSGYVMARTYEKRFCDNLGPIGFLRIRLRRLWPTMALGGAIGLVPLYGISGGADPEFLRAAFANFLLLPAFAFGLSFALNPPSWSIFFELLANLGHALALRRVPTWGLLVLCALLIPALAAIGMEYGLDVGSKSETFVFGLCRVGFSYTLGVALWRIWQDRPSFPVTPMFSFLAMPAIFIGTIPVSGISWLADLLFIAVVAPMMLAGGLAYDKPSRLASFGGAISFPLYAVHGPILEWCRQAGTPIIFGIIVSVAIASFVAYPGQALARRLTRPFRELAAA